MNMAKPKDLTTGVFAIPDHFKDMLPADLEVEEDTDMTLMDGDNALKFEATNYPTQEKKRSVPLDKNAIRNLIPDVELPPSSDNHKFDLPPTHDDFSNSELDAMLDSLLTPQKESNDGFLDVQPLESNDSPRKTERNEGLSAPEHFPLNSEPSPSFPHTPSSERSMPPSDPFSPSQQVAPSPQTSPSVPSSDINSFFGNRPYDEEMPISGNFALEDLWFEEDPEDITMIDSSTDTPSQATLAEAQAIQQCHSSLTYILQEIEKGSEIAFEDLEDLFHRYDDFIIQASIDQSLLHQIERVFEDLYLHAVDLFLIKSHLTALGIFRLCAVAQPNNPLIEHNIQKLEKIILTPDKE